MKLSTKICLIVLLVSGFASITHALVFPQETRCILIDFYNFEKNDDLYFRSSTSLATQEELKKLINKAEGRVGEFWGEKTTKPKYIYCSTEEDYLKFGAPFLTPASAIMKFGAYIVISKDGFDLDILAHEISHTELYERIGFFNRLFEIPIWFDEGLAMQVDHRSYYSIDTLKKKSNNFRNLPSLKNLETGGRFWSGTKEEVMMNYMASKYEVQKWHSQEKLKTFVNSINAGLDFQEAMLIP